MEQSEEEQKTGIKQNSKKWKIGEKREEEHEASRTWKREQKMKGLCEGEKEPSQCIMRKLYSADCIVFVEAQCTVK